MNRSNLQTVWDRAQTAKSALVGAAMASPLLAMAQAGDPFSDALTSLTTKVTTYGTALAAFAAVSVAFFVAIKYIKKIPRAS